MVVIHTAKNDSDKTCKGTKVLNYLNNNKEEDSCSYSFSYTYNIENEMRKNKPTTNDNKTLYTNKIILRITLTKTFQDNLGLGRRGEV